VDFNAKLKLFENSIKMVVNYVVNREAVATHGTPLQIKLSSLHKRIAQTAAEVSVRAVPICLVDHHHHHDHYHHHHD
jgi:hypothetical protein